MRTSRTLVFVVAVTTLGCAAFVAWGQQRRTGDSQKVAPAQERNQRQQSKDKAGDAQGDSARQVPDPAAEAVAVRQGEATRPEQQITDHDRSHVFDTTKQAMLTTALKDQPKGGRITGFDFARDPLNADKPFTTFEEVMQKESAARDQVMAAQRNLLEARYDLEPRLDSQAKMSRGKPLPVGPTARLGAGLTWNQLGDMTPAEIKRRGAFPYPSLPHPLQANGGQVFPKMQIDMFPRLERFDVQFDIPDAFLPEFPPAIFLQERPELGDVSRGQVVSMANFRQLFKEIMTPVQLEGMRLLLTPLPQEEFNLTDDRKSRQPQQGVACLDSISTATRRGNFI